MYFQGAASGSKGSDEDFDSIFSMAYPQCESSGTLGEGVAILPFEYRHGGRIGEVQAAGKKDNIPLESIRCRHMEWNKAIESMSACLEVCPQLKKYILFVGTA